MSDINHKNKICKSSAIILLLFLFVFSSNLKAQSCGEIFSGAAQNSNAMGSVSFYWGSTLNTPSTDLETTSLTDYSGTNSCGSGACSATGTTVPESDFTAFPAVEWWTPSVTAYPWWSPTATPGSYNNLYVGSGATLTMDPGVYIFSGNFTMESNSELVVSGAGSVTIFVQGTVNINFASTVNALGGDRYVFIFSRDSISLQSSTTLNAVLYAYNDITLSSSAELTGAVTARDDIVLNSPSTINYDQGMVDGTDFDSFCTAVPPTPTPIPTPTPTPAPATLVGEWRLDEETWDGTADEVLDNSGNGLHGYAVSQGSFPEPLSASPAIAGDPGTCGYGDFDNSGSSNDGHLEIPDPGDDSILDLASYTVSVWVYPNSYHASQRSTIVSKDENFEFDLLPDGRIRWWWNDDAGTTWNWGNPQTTASIPLNEWHHIALTYSPSSYTVYIDGVVAPTIRDAGAPLPLPAIPIASFNNDNLLIGRDYEFGYTHFDGLIDEVRIYDQPLSQAEVAAVMIETHPCSLVTLDHFVIDVGSGYSSTCMPMEITITAEDSDDNTVLDYTGTISISTSTDHGDWDKTATATDAQGTLTQGATDLGAADYEFEASELDQGSITLELASSHAETLTITVEDSDAGVTTTSADLTFSENAFVVTATDSLADDVVAGRSHQFQVEMIKGDPLTGSCGPAAEYDVADVKVWLNRAAADPSGAAPSLTSATETETPPDSAPVTNNFTLPFVDGVADFSLLAGDVARYAINFRDDDSGFSDQPIAGGSSTFVVRPFAFDIQVAGNPAATSASGGVLTAAGTDFSATVRAVAWSAADDSDDNGIADGHDDNDPTNNANLSDNTALASFGGEDPIEGVQLASTLQLPLGNDPGLSTSDTAPADGRELESFSAGTDTTNSIYFAEVGIIELEASVLDGDYLSAGTTYSDRIVGRSGYVGRFRPAYLTVTPNTLTPACNLGGYSYMGEPYGVEYTVSAFNALTPTAQLTQNYTGNFARWNPSGGLGSVSYGAIDGAASTALSSRISGTTTVVWGNGTSSVDASLTLARGSAEDGPYSLLNSGVLLSDHDGVGLQAADLDLDVDNDTTNDHIDLGQTSVVFGRLRLADSFGPETANLPVEFVTEYWNGSVWANHTDDSCTAIALADITYPSGTIDDPLNRTVTLGAGSTTGIYGDISGGTVNFTGGDAGHYFTAPSAGNTGEFQVDVDLTNYPWLRFDWNDDGLFTDLGLPTATFTFGSYRGHDRIIYWQEVLN